MAKVWLGKICPWSATLGLQMVPGRDPHLNMVDVHAELPMRRLLSEMFGRATLHDQFREG